MHSVPLLVILSKKSNLFPEKAQDNILSEKMPVYWGEMSTQRENVLFLAK
jgi:hypothetical protein